MSTNFRKILYNWLNTSHYWLLPGTCVLCRRDSGRPLDLCPACESALPGIARPCHRCGLPLPPGYTVPVCGACLVSPPPFTRLLAPYHYIPPLTALITGFKYRGKLANGRILSRCLGDYLTHRYRSGEWPALIVPTPLHVARQRQRGFNQALEIAGYLSRALEIPVARRVLKRRRPTDSQTGLGARERRRNLHRAFSVDPVTDAVQGRTVALIDDVVTTAATATAMSRALIRAGAAEVHVWALARTCL